MKPWVIFQFTAFWNESWVLSCKQSNLHVRGQGRLVMTYRTEPLYCIDVYSIPFRQWRDRGWLGLWPRAPSENLQNFQFYSWGPNFWFGRRRHLLCHCSSMWSWYDEDSLFKLNCLWILGKTTWILKEFSITCSYNQWMFKRIFLKFYKTDVSEETFIETSL